MPKGAPISFAVCDAYRYFAGQAKTLTSQRRSRIEYLILTDNIIVLDCYYNLTNKSNRNGRL